MVVETVLLAENAATYNRSTGNYLLVRRTAAVDIEAAEDIADAADAAEQIAVDSVAAKALSGERLYYLKCR